MFSSPEFSVVFTRKQIIIISFKLKLQANGTAGGGGTLMVIILSKYVLLGVSL